MRRLTLPLLVIALALAAAACGGGEGGAGTTAGGPPARDLGLIQPGVLSVASDMPRRPFLFTRPGTGAPAGFEADLLRAIADRLGIGTVRFLDRPARAIVPAVAAGRADVSASTWTITPEPAARVAFGEPYLSANPAIVVRRDSAVAGLDDLEGATIGVARGTVGADLAETVVGATVRRHPTPGAAIAALSRGGVDAAIAPFPDAVAAAARRPALKIAAEVPGDLGIGLMFPAREVALREAADRALEELRADGTYDRIYERWFGAATAA